MQDTEEKNIPKEKRMISFCVKKVEERVRKTFLYICYGIKFLDSKTFQISLLIILKNN